MKDVPTEAKPSPVADGVASIPPTQGGERLRWSWAEPSVWTERMLSALENGVKGGGAFFVSQGLFTRLRTYEPIRQSVTVHQLESRMREIRLSGSEGGETDNPSSLPLSWQ